ncbi:MAG: PilC/PilY family type IV pilus protein [Deltaproteobacteria bacterium]|nr:PilC/PilY family type IV pilus protein [Deltaproteobacteria bacterium]
MKSKILCFLICGILCCCLTAAAGAAEPAGEEALFTTSTAPDALIVLDLSGSMDWNPPGDDLTYGSTNSCTADPINCTGTGCSGGFCGSSKSSVTYYAATTCGTADPNSCIGTNCANGFCSVPKTSSSFYAATTCNTADLNNCKGAGCGRTDGFCSNSMSGVTFYAHDATCTADTYHCRHTESWSDCADGFCASSHHNSSYTRTCQQACTSNCNTACATPSCNVSCTSGGCTKSCSRMAIAKRAIANILDDNNDGTINSTDETSLGVRLGYMRFKNCGDDEPGGGLSYTSNCNTLVKAINTSYSSINTSVQAESASGGTPINSALNEAKLYLTDHKAADNAKECRQKFVILITDGSDTYACDADGSECDPHRYKNRRAVVAKAKMLSDAGFKVFVIGFGTAMPPYLKNTLNWMAYYGGTNNPNTADAGDPTAYSIVTGCKIVPETGAKTNPAVCCDVTASACYPSGVTACQTDSAALQAQCYDATKPYPGTTGNTITSFQASSNDPGYLPLEGYAFIAGSADELVAAVKAAINIIREATYSFSQSSIQSNRTVDENFIYEGSFQPLNDDPFWIGHLKKFNVKGQEAGAEEGEVGEQLWDAGLVLQGPPAPTRNIKTYKTGSPLALDDITTVTKENLAVATDADRDAVVNFIRGGDTAYPVGHPNYGWKLGDVFRSTPITVGTPSLYYEDARDTISSSTTCIEGLGCQLSTTKTVNAFGKHRCDNCRASANGKRIVTVGANDGQLHAFKTSNGSEAWSFIAPNILSRLKLIAHATHPTTLSHQYYVDGPVTVADVWITAREGASDGTSKAPGDWKTLLVFAEGRGASTNIWSSSTYCDSGFNPMYTSTYKHYCGYYALDLTNSLNPAFQWRLGGQDGMSETEALHMGAPWSRMLTGRVKIGGKERWLGFIGGGVYAPNATHSGKGFFAVDLYDGKVVWSYTRANNSALDNPMPSPPAIVDTDNDGFIDTVYIGDIGGHMWRMKFCKAADGDSCTTSNWTGARFFEAKASSGIRPIYTLAAVSKDAEGNFWVYWGTGDKTDPTATIAQEKIFAVKDTDFTSTVTGDQIQDITSSGSVYNNPGMYGYYITLTGSGEKMLSDVTVFGGVLYVATFTPEQSNKREDAFGRDRLRRGALRGHLHAGAEQQPLQAGRCGEALRPRRHVGRRGAYQ